MYISLQPKALMIATDGSDTSKEAFFQSLDFVTNDHHIYLTHISDSRKSYLPLEFRTTYIWEDYKNELLSRFSSKRYDLVFEEKNAIENNMRDQILKIALSLKVNYLFIGYSGRKGKKMDISLMGQTVKNSIYKSSVPIVVVKYLYPRKSKPDNSFNFMVCVDGSEKSYKALESAIELSNDPSDTLYFCYAPSNFGEQNVETLKVKFDSFHDKYKEKKLVFLPLKSSNDPLATIVDFVNFNDKINIDFVVFGNNGVRAQLEGKNFIGRMAENILTNVKANPVIIP